ncbi:hypothetical protein PIB30_081985, partial [Stylosanthes scabra]|nr:hypothetical protein [Stylosanthes scabra]
GQMEIEELRQARNSKKPNNNKNDNMSNRPHPNGNNRDSKKSFQPTPRFEEYTQFKTKKGDIMKEILNSKLIKLPKNAENYKDQKNTDMSKYCTFHQKNGHNTVDCVIANDLLERLAQQGHLDKYIDGHIFKANKVSLSNTNKGKKVTGETPRGEINHISGGFAGGGHTNSTRERFYRAMLSVEGVEFRSPTQHNEIPKSPLSNPTSTLPPPTSTTQ